MPDETAPKSKKKIAKRWYAWVGGVVGLIIISLLVLHFSPLHYWQDPVETVQEYVQVRSAKTDIQRANVHLALAEKHYKYFVALSKKSPNSRWLPKQVNKMVGHDDVAMIYMDNAKKADINIKDLVQRLCDDLDTQYATVKGANLASAAHIEGMSKHAWDLESSLDVNGRFNQQLYAIRTGLAKAMTW